MHIVVNEIRYPRGLVTRTCNRDLQFLGCCGYQHLADMLKTVLFQQGVIIIRAHAHARTREHNLVHEFGIHLSHPEGHHSTIACPHNINFILNPQKLQHLYHTLRLETFGSLFTCGDGLTEENEIRNVNIEFLDE